MKHKYKIIIQIFIYRALCKQTIVYKVLRRKTDKTTGEKIHVNQNSTTQDVEKED